MPGTPVDDVALPVLEASAADGIARLLLPASPAMRGAGPGQFALLRNPSPGSPLLPRPLSILSEGDNIAFVYNIVGEGTRALALLGPGDTIHLVGPLGHPFEALSDPLLIVADGSHVGTMLALARARQDRPEVIYVADLPADPATTWLVERFTETSKVTLTDRAGLPAALRRAAPATVAAGACDTVMAEVQRYCAEAAVPGVAALQAPMACGLGVCQVCVRPFRGGALRLICEGPMFPIEDAVFADG